LVNDEINSCKTDLLKLRKTALVYAQLVSDLMGYQCEDWASQYPKHDLTMAKV
jgi:hypothetical protein